ncbi:MAG: acylaldehyde oxidase [Methylibium sp. NZG]|nr:MAG: acylaldehyde oxidase [Methylibium sp. NZG]
MTRRRTFILGTVAAVGAVVVGWSILPPRQRLAPSQPLPATEGQMPLNGWVKIGADNTVTVMLAKSEMGQGVHTSLAMLLADELDADWSSVRIEAAPVDAIYGNLAAGVDGLPFHPDDPSVLKRGVEWMTAKAMRELGVMVTGGSTSVKDLLLPMREAGASARAMLVGAAAEQWKVPAGECRTLAGRVLHGNDKSASFGELAAAAALRDLPRGVALKAPSAFTLIGKPIKRIEGRAKANGSAVFGIDVLPPGLLYASVVMCPTLGGTVAAFDGAAASELPGVKAVLKVSGHHGGTAGVAVIADQPYRAMKAVKLVNVTWAPGEAAAFSSDAAMKQLSTVLDSEHGFGYFKTGDVDAAMKAAAKVLVAEYRAPYLAHATMEPINCTVQVKDGSATVWASTQVPSIARGAVADVLGIDAKKVDVRVQLLGGGFGRRLEVDFIAQAAEIALAADGEPVQTIWSREEDVKHDFYRPACVARFQAGLDAQGRLTAWRNASAGQAVVPQVLARNFGLPGVGPDKTTSEGAFDQPYEFANARIGHEIVDLPVPVGFWRSVGHSHQAFFKEGFIDEVAHGAGQDPVAFRASLLQQHPRHLAVLNRCAQEAGWGQALAPAADGAKRARGIALHHSFGSVVAQVAEVSVGADKRIRVHRVVCVIDCGLAVNPGLIRQQMESGIVFGLGAALYGRIDIAGGQVQQSNYHDVPMLRFDECPVIETHIMPSTAHPEGVGEPGTPPIAPAVANALFALTGQRLRELPLALA